MYRCCTCTVFISLHCHYSYNLYDMLILFILLFLICCHFLFFTAASLRSPYLKVEDCSRWVPPSLSVFLVWFVSSAAQEGNLNPSATIHLRISVAPWCLTFSSKNPSKLFLTLLSQCKGILTLYLNPLFLPTKVDQQGMGLRQMGSLAHTYV